VVSARVLVVGETTAVGNMAAPLESEGYQVTAAHSVSEALVALRDHTADAVVTAYQLPDGDGVELLREINASYETLPVVIYAAEGDEHAASAAIDAGVSSYIPQNGDRAAERLIEAIDETAITAPRKGQTYPRRLRRVSSEQSTRHRSGLRFPTPRTPTTQSSTSTTHTRR